MPALNFRAEFSALVESGRKRQTIRAYRKDGRDPKPGDTLHLYVGLRTKGARKLAEVRCVGVERIRIAKVRGATSITLRRRRLDFEEAHALALADGFDSLMALRLWFESVHGLPFDGIVIRWIKESPCPR